MRLLIKREQIHYSVMVETVISTAYSATNNIGIEDREPTIEELSKSWIWNREN